MEYYCNNCDTTRTPWTIWYTEEDTPVCPNCRSEDLEKIGD
jgi:hypothetical protein